MPPPAVEPGQSEGCALVDPALGAPGESHDMDLTVDGRTTTLRVTLPSAYDHTVAWPLLLSFHGWGGDHTAGSKYAQHGKTNGYVVAAPTGYGRSGWSSWNGAGTVASPGPAGPTCTEFNTDYCYTSCGGCADGCWWTTCLDSVEQSVALLDALEAALCLNTSRISRIETVICLPRCPTSKQARGRNTAHSCCVARPPRRIS
jgi:hypothetical protein